MDMFLELIKSFPWFSDLVMIMGTARIIFKPLFTLIETIISTTPSKEDDKKWEDIKGSKMFAFLMYLVDYVASVKIPTKK